MGCTTSTMDVTRLPFELLVEIFSHETKPNVLMTVAQVCRHWHHVVLHESSLWTEVCVTPDTTPAQLNLQLARSGAHALSVEVSFRTSGSPDDLDQCLSTIMLEYELIEALVITSDYNWGFRQTVKTSWPAGLVALLLPGRIWPRLRTLRLNGELWSFNDFRLCLVAPVLRDLELHTVRVRDWHCFGLGSRMRRLQVSDTGTRGLFATLRGCMSLESLLVKDSIAHNYDTLHYDNSLALPTFHSLTHLDIKWAAIDLNMLIDLLAHCPNAERVSISHDKTLEPLASPYTGSLYMLSHLRAITLRSQWGGDDTLLHSLAPFIDSSGLEHMELNNMRFIDPSGSFGAALRTLKLTGLVYESGDLVQALSQCTKLESLTIDRIITSTHDDRPVVMPLPLLRSVTVDCITKHHGLSSDILGARNRRLVDIIMALLPLPGVREVTIRPIPLARTTHISLTIGHLRTVMDRLS
ncbi:hypothetical protein EXIGLDRAFT_776319 [Exidia glandulosa HHB12029]|uniref:F-box domain-containing protein n=1 Tax=Exidia glandulosa HHB12029 TaxID=1314781 RepID=A0A165DIV0_EXIGL|nr:hypothetical protein EXIGLDRAFT_776319 [Exidia glandulosa HHB12029]